MTLAQCVPQPPKCSNVMLTPGFETIPVLRIAVFTKVTDLKSDLKLERAQGHSSNSWVWIWETHSVRLACMCPLFPEVWMQPTRTLQTMHCNFISNILCIEYATISPWLTLDLHNLFFYPFILMLRQLLEATKCLYILDFPWNKPLHKYKENCLPCCPCQNVYNCSRVNTLCLHCGRASLYLACCF